MSPSLLVRGCVAMLPLSVGSVSSIAVARVRPVRIRCCNVNSRLLVLGCVALPAPASGLIAAAVGVSGPRVPGVAP